MPASLSAIARLLFVMRSNSSIFQLTCVLVFQVVKKLLQKSIPGVPRLQINIVDVRDVARAHVLALTSDKAAGSITVLI